MIKNYGLQFKEIQNDHHILGSIDDMGEIINPSGDWLLYLPEGEYQARNFETFGCTVWATLNALETLLSFKFRIKVNFSDRFIYNLAQVVPPGADPHDIIEIIRKNGLKKEDLVYPETLEEFAKPRPPSKEDLLEAKRFLDDYVINHKWVWNNNSNPQTKKTLIQEALKKGTVCVSVVAWKERNGKYYKEMGENDTHWTHLVNYFDFSKVNDSYPESEGDFIKDLENNYDFMRAKVYFLRKKTEEEKKAELNGLLELLKRALLWLTLLLKRKELTEIQKDVESIEPITPPLVIVEPPKYEWNNKVSARHSVRILCDENGLSLAEKNLICAVIKAESDFDINAIHHNNGGTTDYSICQFNDGKNKKGIPYWIGEGADFESPQEVMQNPEKAVRIMIREFKKGNINYWNAFSNKSYLKYL